MCDMPVIALELLRIVMHNHVAWFFNRNVFFFVKVTTCVKNQTELHKSINYF